MTSMQLRRGDVIVGVDTHMQQHVAVLLDGLGGKLDGVAEASCSGVVRTWTPRLTVV